MNNINCVLPFHHLFIGPGNEIKPCCMFNLDPTDNEKYLGNEDMFQSDTFENIRTNIRSNIPVSGCSRCYHQDKMSGDSYRTIFLKRYKDTTGVDFTPPNKGELVFLEISFSNICNNRCRMCSPVYSTNWYSDAKKLGTHIPVKGIVETDTTLKNLDLKKLKFIKISGGEPLMEQQKIIDLLNSCSLENINLFVNTNATILPTPELMELFKKCQSIEVNLSIDAYGDLNDFLRKGSTWAEVEKNLKWFYDNFEKIRIHSTITAYNVNCYDQLIDYIKTNFPRINHDFMMVFELDWMKVSNLPNSAKIKVQEKNVVFKEKYNLPITDFILKDLNSQGNVSSFLTMDKKLNDIRNENWENCNKELYDWVNH
jgi:organic radical activating enzyme